MRIVLTVAALVFALGARPAAACGVPDFGRILSDVAQGLDGEEAPVHTPIVIVGTGTSTEGAGVSLAAGYAWGTQEVGGLFPSTDVWRVLVGYRHASDSKSLSLTYGWYTTALLSFGVDVGAEAQLTGVRSLGPTARVTLGARGVGVRLTGGVGFGEDTHATGAAEVVVELKELLTLAR